MNITVLCSSPEHPVNAWLEGWQAEHQHEHKIEIRRDKSELNGGDVLFLVSCGQIIDAPTRSCYSHTLVLHASDVPIGRGWSPHIWALLEGSDNITLSVLNAEDSVDTGNVWAKKSIPVPHHALHDEIHRSLFKAELDLMDKVLDMIRSGVGPLPQRCDVMPTYYRKRSAADSEIDPALPLSHSFNAVRLMDPKRYPAFFRLHGHRYTIEVKKVSRNEDNHD